jgi:DNA-binding cell septation regulator SpoVG
MTRQNKKGNKKSDDFKEVKFSAGTIRIYEGKKNDYGTISLDCGFAIRIQIVDGKNGVFISYPSYRDSNNNYIGQAFCFDKDVNNELQDIINKLYD